MYHPGKVLKVFSPSKEDVISADTSTQAMVHMWDENLTTILVHKSLSHQVKENDIVLVDYRPISSTIPVPRLVVTKILRGSHATDTWKTYEERYRSLKGKPVPLFPSPGGPLQPSHSYIG